MDSSNDSDRVLDILATLPPSEIVREQSSEPEQAQARAAIASLGMTLEPEASAYASDDVRARVLASVISASTTGRYGIFADRIARLFDIDLASATDYLARIARDGEWGPGPMAGVSILPVMPGPKLGFALATFTKFEPGVVFPLHAHIGSELTLLLEGGFRDASGVEMWRGDELYKPPGSEHDFLILPGGICIAAAVAVGGIDLR